MGRHDEEWKKEKLKVDILEATLAMMPAHQRFTVWKWYENKVLAIICTLSFEDDTFKYLARACIGRATWCPNVTCYHTLTHVKNVLLVNKFNNDPRYKKLHLTLERKIEANYVCEYDFFKIIANKLYSIFI